MAGNELPGALYDFLYRDTYRLASCYAQLFRGVMTSREGQRTVREAEENVFKGSLAAVAGEHKDTRDTSQIHKEVFDPHDLVTRDVLAGLSEQGRIHPDIEQAPNGALVVAKGSILFQDGSLLKMMGSAADLANSSNKPKNQQERSDQATLRVMAKILNALNLPSFFVMQTDDGAQIVGTIKEDGMTEPILTHLYKHGPHGISGAAIVGIKEVGTSAPPLDATQLLGAGQNGAQIMSTLLFPPDAIRVTPLAIFRELV